MLNPSDDKRSFSFGSNTAGGVLHTSGSLGLGFSGGEYCIPQEITTLSGLDVVAIDSYSHTLFVTSA